MSTAARLTNEHALRGESASAAWIAGGLIGLAAVVAVGVRLCAAPAARGWLGFTFPGTPNTFGSVETILAHNLRLMVGVFVGAGVAQVALVAPPAPVSGQLVRATTRMLDVVFAALAAAHALVIGAGVGAYGERMIAALLPHGPVELFAFSLALGVYVTARRGRLSLRRFTVAAAGSCVVLVVAAVLEVFVTP